MDTQDEWLNQLHERGEKPPAVQAGELMRLGFKLPPEWVKSAFTVVRVDPTVPMNVYDAPDGSQVLRALTLRQARELIGGDLTGTATNPITGEAVEVSLEEFKDDDPDTTYVRIMAGVVSPDMPMENY